MTPEKDRQISAIFHAARELNAEERAAFLAEACADDHGLRHEVEALLEGDARAGDFLRQPVHAVVGDLLGPGAQSSSFRITPLIGERLLDRYQVLSRLGAGGMGEVFLAEDSLLDRRVAIKLLPIEFTSDTDRLRRFIREAKAASALNHPNIVTIHEIRQAETKSGSVYFIVTEYVEGQTLRERMFAERMPLNVALDVAVQVAAALSAAHQAGIIHRDIKPENIMVRQDGYVKLLDFGLAKLMVVERGEEQASANSQVSLSTEPGRVLGTAKYMSPEQACGDTVDARTDIFSLGVVIYEMIAGRIPFGGANAVEVMRAILNQEPPPLGPHIVTNEQVVVDLERIVTKALRKNPDERYQSSNELLVDLRKTKSDSDALAVVSSGKLSAIKLPVDKRRLGWIAALMLAVVGSVGAAVYYGLIHSPERKRLLPSVVPFASLPGHEFDPNFSPDGNELAFGWDGAESGQQDQQATRADIYIKSIGAGAPLRLTSDLAIERSPVWSPDGRFIAFIRAGTTGEMALVIPALGGPERNISPVGMGSINWSPDGKWLLLTDLRDNNNAAPILMISLETGERRRLTSPPSSSFDQLPAISHDGRRLAFVRDNGKVFVSSVSGGDEKLLAADIGMITGLIWTADGKEILVDSGLVGNWTLWRLNPSGGKPEALLSERAGYRLPALSPQGNRLAVVDYHFDTDCRRLDLAAISPGGLRLKREGLTRVITSQNEDHSAQYAPDGTKIAFVSTRGGTTEVWVCASDGSNPVQLTKTSMAGPGSPRWSPDSRRLVYDSHPEQHGDVFMIDAEGGPVRRMTTEKSDDILPSWSRDGAWIYFSSDRTGRRELWKMPSSGGPAVQLTKEGGFEAEEAPDGKTLYYSKGYLNGLWTVPNTGGEERPVPALADTGHWRAWTMTRDGIYFIAKTGSSAPYPLKFFSFATQRSTQIGTLEAEPLKWLPSLAVSEDGRWLLFSLVERDTSNIMLIENFR